MDKGAETEQTEVIEELNHMPTDDPLWYSQDPAEATDDVPQWTVLTHAPTFIRTPAGMIQNGKKKYHTLAQEKAGHKTTMGGSKIYTPESQVPLANVVGATLLKPKSGKDKDISINFNSSCRLTGTLQESGPCRILIDTGATSTVLNKKFVASNTYLRGLEPLREKRMMRVRVASGQIINTDTWLLFNVKIQGHLFQLLAMVMPLGADVDLILGVKTLIELEAQVDLITLKLTMPVQLIPCKVTAVQTLDQGSEITILLTLEGPHTINSRALLRYVDPTTQRWTAELIVFTNGRTTIKLLNTAKNTAYQVGDCFGYIDARSTDTYERSLALLWRLGQDEPTSKSSNAPITLANLADVLTTPPKKSGRKKQPEDPYPWLAPDDKRRDMSDEEILRSVINLDESALNDEDKEKFMQVLIEHKAAFSLRDEIGECPRLRIKLQLHDTTPFYKRPFPIKPGEKEIIDKEMDRMVALGVLEKGLSGYSSPIMLVPRKGSPIPRVVTDFRHLNTKLVRLNVAFPLVRDTLQVLGDSGCEVISVIDLRDAYHTLRLEDDSKQYCGIIPYYGSDSYLYQRLGMGLSVSPAIWQTFINFILQNIPEPNHHIAIMDDCMTYSKAHDHLKHITALLTSLITHGLKISPRKCQFFRKEICYMGSTISITPSGVTFEILRTRAEAIQNLKPPTNAKECRMLCGMVNYVATFVPYLKDILLPIYELTRKNRPFVWNQIAQDAFDALQKQLASPPVLYMPNSTGRFQLYSDTSHYATGAALYQIQQGLPRLIGYASKKLLPAVKNYSITELELYGLKLNIDAFQHLLSRVEFDAVVDHSALVYIVKAHKEPATARLKKYLEELRRYCFKLHYIKGKDMVPGDFLSRYPREGEADEENIPIVCVMTRAQARALATPEKALDEPEEPVMPPHPDDGPSTSRTHLPVGPTHIQTDQECATTIPPQYYNEPLQFPIPKDIAEQLRKLPKQAELEPTIQKIQGKYLIDTHLNLSERDLKNAYLNSTFRDIYRFLQDGSLPTLKRRQKVVIGQANWYVLAHGFLYHVYKPSIPDYANIRLVIPEHLSDLVFHTYHNTLLGGHQGITRTYLTIRKFYHIPNLFENLSNYVRACHECQMVRRAEVRDRLFIERVPKEYTPMSAVSCDIKYMPKTADGFKYMLVVTCDITGFVLVCPLREITGPHLSEALLQTVIWIFGPPKQLVIDEERALSGQVMKRIYDTLGIDVKTISPYNHGSLITERYIQTVSNSLIRYLDGSGEKWVYLVKLICYALNSFKSSKTGFSPYELVFGRDPRPLLYNMNPFPGQHLTYAEYHQSLLDRFKQYEDTVNLRNRLQQNRERLGRKATGYCRGQLVYLLSPRTSLLQTSQKKFTLNYVGPLVVSAVVNPYQYELMDLEGVKLRGLFHFNRLKLAYLKIWGKGSATSLKELKQAWKEAGWDEYSPNLNLPDAPAEPTDHVNAITNINPLTPNMYDDDNKALYLRDPDVIHLQLDLVNRLQ